MQYYLHIDSIKKYTNNIYNNKRKYNKGSITIYITILLSNIVTEDCCDIYILCTPLWIVSLCVHVYKYTHNYRCTNVTCHTCIPLCVHLYLCWPQVYRWPLLHKISKEKRYRWRNHKLYGFFKWATCTLSSMLLILYWCIMTVDIV